MKKYKFLIVIVLLVFLLTSCDVQSSIPEEIVPSIENPTIEQKVTEAELKSEPEPELAKTSLSFSSVENKIDENYLNYSEQYELISNLENTKIRTHINQAIESVIKKTKNNTLQIERALYDPSIDLPLQMEVTGNPVYFDDHILSYEIMYKMKRSDEEEHLSYTFLNYDLSTGQTIKITDLLSLEQLYSQIEMAYPESFEEPFNPDQIGNINQSFRFSSEDSAVFVIAPYELTYEQKQFIKVPLKDIQYDPSNKRMIGASIINDERVENADYYEIFFSYPHFDGIDGNYSDINQDVVQHERDFYDYGTSMAILDHSPVEPPVNDSIEGTTTESTNSTSQDPDEFDLPIYWYNLSYEIYTNNEKILSFGLYDYQYTGGAHGLSSGTFYSYDLELGRQIELKDLFESKFDYITYINDQIYRKIDQETKENPESSYAYYDFSGIDENVKFYIEDNELVIFFDQYEIAAYAAGTPTFRIPLP